MAIQKPGKRVQEEKTAAIPVLQNEQFYIPSSQKKNEPMLFAKTTVVNALAMEPILKEKKEIEPASQERQQTMILKEGDIPKSRIRKERPQEQTSSIFWIALFVLILIFMLFMLISRF